jgi:hypothetical protein
MNCMEGHAYTVEFRILGPTLDAEAVSRDLGLAPCQTRTPSAHDARGRVAQGMWAYNGPPGSPREWVSLEEGVRYVLENLWPHRDKIATYYATSRPLWWCGHFQSAFDGGPTLSAELLRKLGEFSVELYIDNYFSTEDSSGESSRVITAVPSRPGANPKIQST